MVDRPTPEDLRPDRHELMHAAVHALKARVDENEMQKFLVGAASNKGLDPLKATASMNLAVWGKLKCEPEGQPWIYDIEIWGAPAFFGSAVGFMYTAYTSWDSFFTKVTGAHAHGIEVGGGFLQINWLAGVLPVGQFNGVVGGAGIAEAGGDGVWKRK